ncbi:hypothetical protein N0V82_003386 [Gnomoniopsis sp. IMI 355080]|nr:hypothetical protein N0V82_003386 [Gnomoniopsis sp. IMI 355080]
MNNFGVIEVASAKTTNAPGWAYVPDTGSSSVPSQSVSAVHLHVNRNKRAARQSNAATGSSAQHHNDISARHDSKLQKEIEQLQRDSLSNVQIPIPSGGRDKDGKIRGHTPNVRKILASQKTFANHLDDFEAWRRTGEGVAGVAGSAGQSSAGGTPAPPAPTSGATKKAATSSSAAQKKTPASSNSRSRSGGGKKVATPAPVADADVTMMDAPSTEEAEADAHPAEPESKMLRPFTRSPAVSHPEDSNPLLESWLPPLPTDEELRELIKAPPLNYIQARGTWGEDESRYPVRSFCEVCGYWGRVRCMKCGTRVCALDCLDVHREECITRYGL